MNILKIVVALLCSYGLFISISYLLARLIFPKIQIEEESDEERSRMVKIRNLRRTHRSVRKQKNLAY